MKDLLRSNIYDVSEVIAIVGSCLINMQPIGYEKIKQKTQNMYELCLEETHINMAITKIGGMLSTGKIKKILFVTVDKSPHCVQMHYIRKEIERMMSLEGIELINYVTVDNELIEISQDIINLSKNLSKLKSMLED